jgi:hypothetical protein
MKTTYRIEWIHGKRRPGVDECDQGWLRVKRDPTIDYTNLLQVINEAFAMEQASENAYTYRVVELSGNAPAKLVA